MNDQDLSSSTREARVYDWIRTLTDFPDRIAGSAYERQAAERIGGWLREIGFTDVSAVPAPGGARTGWSLALHTGLGLLGCYWGGLLGILLALVALISFRREQSKRGLLLSRLLPAHESVNVIGRAGNPTAARRVIVSAHIDTTEAGWMFSKSVAEQFAQINQSARRPDDQPQPPHAVPALLLLLAVVVATGGWLGAHGFLFGLLKLGVCGGLLIATALGIQWAMSPATPGANDNASAVAAMLTCAEQLRNGLPEDVELWVVGTGAEECGHGGMRSIVDQHPDWSREHTFYVNFECVGGGHLHYIVSEGMLSRVSYPPMLIELARRVAAGGRFGEITPTHLLAGTDGNVPAHLGYPTLSLITLEATGVPRNYHRPEDTVDGIDLAAVVRAADFGTAVARAALHGAAGPIET